MKVQATLLFSKNNKIGSKCITWLCHHQNKFSHIIETPSHVALVLQKRWVFEAVVGKGVVVQSFDKWSANNIVCHFIDLGQCEYQDIADEFRKIKSKPYDYIGAFYLGLCLLLNKFIRIPIPRNNLLECKRCYFCSEAVGAILNKNLSMTTPTALMCELESQNKTVS